MQLQLEAINEIARIATSDLELRPMMQRITDALARKFEWEFVALVSVDPDRTNFVCEAMTSALPTEIRRLQPPARQWCRRHGRRDREGDSSR